MDFFSMFAQIGSTPMFLENVLQATFQLSIAAEHRMLDPEG